MIPTMKLIRVNRGLSNVVDMILGRTRYDAEFTPIISIASICSVILIVPISDEMLEPIFPARIRHTIVEENSRMRDSLAIYPMYILGSRGEVILLDVWMTNTAPMNMEISAIRGMELITSLSASLKKFLMKMLHFSGFLKVFFRKRKYFPIW